MPKQIPDALSSDNLVLVSERDLSIDLMLFCLRKGKDRTMTVLVRPADQQEGSDQAEYEVTIHDLFFTKGGQQIFMYFRLDHVLMSIPISASTNGTIPISKSENDPLKYGTDPFHRGTQTHFVHGSMPDIGDIVRNLMNDDCTLTYTSGDRGAVRNGPFSGGTFSCFVTTWRFARPGILEMVVREINSTSPQRYLIIQDFTQPQSQAIIHWDHLNLSDLI